MRESQPPPPANQPNNSSDSCLSKTPRTMVAQHMVWAYLSNSCVLFSYTLHKMQYDIYTQPMSSRQTTFYKAFKNKQTTA